MMDMKDLCHDFHFASTQDLLDNSSSSSSSSPSPLISSHQAFLIPSPSSSSSSSSSSSFLCGDSGSSLSGGGGVRVGVMMSQRFTITESFSAQVDSVLRGDFLSPVSAGPRRVCLVCGDLASGFHYGVASCEACKAFFKRSVQGNIAYSCPVTNECEITKRRRKSCQSCRFQKCLRAGMMREGVRLDRVRGGRQKYKRRMETTPTTSCRNTLAVTTGTRNRLISHLLLTDPAPLAANHDESTNEGGLRTLVTLSDLLNRDLLRLIAWAKHIPGFSGLSLADQMALLQGGWMEALLVGVAWRSQGIEGAELVFAGNLRLDEAQCRAAGLDDLYEALCHLADRYRTMRLSQEEAAALKAMVLANADADLVDPDSVQMFQDRLHEALQEHESSRGGQHRAGRILMSLPLLRQSSSRAVQTLLRLHRVHSLPLPRLLLEMLEAKT